MSKSWKTHQKVNDKIALTTCHNYTLQKTKTEFVLHIELSIPNMSNRMHWTMGFKSFLKWVYTMKLGGQLVPHFRCRCIIRPFTIEFCLTQFGGRVQRRTCGADLRVLLGLYSLIILLMYVGANPCSALYVSKVILYTIFRPQILEGVLLANGLRFKTLKYHRIGRLTGKFFSTACLMLESSRIWDLKYTFSAVFTG